MCSFWSGKTIKRVSIENRGQSISISIGIPGSEPDISIRGSGPALLTENPDIKRFYRIRKIFY